MAGVFYVLFPAWNLSIIYSPLLSGNQGDQSQGCCFFFLGGCQNLYFNIVTKILCLNSLVTGNSDALEATSSIRNILSSIKSKFIFLTLPANMEQIHSLWAIYKVQPYGETTEA